MKKLIYLAVVFLLFSCGNESNENKKEIKKHKRIGSFSSNYEIVTVDSCEYLCNYWYGGIVHLETCKNH